MTITIELKPEIETYARKQANDSGVPLEDYIASVIKTVVSERELDQVGITKQLDEIYATHPSELDAFFQKMQTASLPAEEW
jgi:hypothetical protein